MPNQVKFVVGDRVRFKPQHYYYRDQQNAPDVFTIVRVNHRHWTPGDDIVFWSQRGGACSHRLESATDGPW